VIVTIISIKNFFHRTIIHNHCFIKDISNIFLVLLNEHYIINKERIIVLHFVCESSIRDETPERDRHHIRVPHTRQILLSRRNGIRMSYDLIHAEFRSIDLRILSRYLRTSSIRASSIDFTFHEENILIPTNRI